MNLKQLFLFSFTHLSDSDTLFLFLTKLNTKVIIFFV